MRFSIVVLFAASLVSAVSVLKRNNDSEYPSCAEKCIEKTDPSPCKRDDTACLCVNYNYVNDVFNCVQSSCSQEDADKAEEAGLKACKAVGIDPQNPIPECGIPCLENAKTSCSDPSEGTCLCQDQGWLEDVASCFKDHCYNDDFKTAKCGGEALCRAAGYDISSVFGY